jgi:hypothetical protein
LNGQFARLGADLNRHSLVNQLREQRMTIICDERGWILSTEAENRHAPSAKVPAQRRPDQPF